MPGYRPSVLRRAVFGILIVAVAGGVAVVLSTQGDDDDAGPAHAAPTTLAPSAEALAAREEIAVRRGVTGTAIEASEALAALRTGIDTVLAQAGVDVRCAVRGADTGTVTGTTVVDPAARAYDASETTIPVGGSSPITEERRLLAGTLYVRAITAGVDPDQTRWDTIPRPTGDAAELDRSLTAFGRIADSLDRVAVLVEQVAGRTERLDDDGGTRSYRITIPSRRIGAFYQRSGLEVVDHLPQGTTTFEFGVDSSGALVRLAVYGTTFHDGEALEDSFLECRYTAVAPPVVAAPPSELLRS